MTGCSLLNDILGPVMRGPSSSHAAAPYAIARTCRELSLSAGGDLVRAAVRFDRDGSFAQVHKGQGSDHGFAAGLLAAAVESPHYREALERLRGPERPFDFSIEICSLPNADHPNLVELELVCRENDGAERNDRYIAVSTGGGSFVIREINGTAVQIDGGTGTLVVEGSGPQVTPPADAILETVANQDAGMAMWRTRRPLNPGEHAALAASTGVECVRESLPRQLLCGGGSPLFLSAADVVQLAKDVQLPTIGVRYESRWLGLNEVEVRREFSRRLSLLLSSVDRGFELDETRSGLRYMTPTARRMKDEAASVTIAGAPMQQAISAALAVMELNSSCGVVCAAPTAGSAGIVPGCLYSLKQRGFDEERLTDALQVMAIVGAIIAIRATFAAEVCGCAAETGAAAAMAAAGIAHLHEASAEAAMEAAAICLMNTLGLVCDPVGGEVEIPCHARNVAGVAHAYAAAASLAGGFRAVIPLDEAVDAMFDVGRALPANLRCMAKGGLAVSPTALRLVEDFRTNL